AADRRGLRAWLPPSVTFPSTSGAGPDRSADSTTREASEARHVPPVTHRLCRHLREAFHPPDRQAPGARKRMSPVGVPLAHGGSELMTRARLAQLAPGVAVLMKYRRADFRYDLAAGLSVAAVAVPVGIAYAALAGFEPVVGLYGSILPLVAYALFGSSRQMIVGPDTATCAMVAVPLTPPGGRAHDQRAAA